MNEIVVKTQAEFDALPAKFETYTRIFIRNDASLGRIIVSTKRENSSVEARDNSSVVAWGNSSVVARDNSSVEARDNSSVVAWGNVGVHLQSDYASVALFMFAVCWALRKGKITKNADTATIIEPKPSIGNQGWLEGQGVKCKDKHVILFKKVSHDFKTQEATPHETVWEVGKTVVHPAWAPTSSECGEGKFHACSRPYFCDEFRNKKGDRYVAIRVAVKDLHAWEKGDYPHKIAFREGTVLYECDKFGRKTPTTTVSWRYEDDSARNGS